MSEIVNRVAQSKLVTLDLEELYPPGKRMVLDIKDWLFEEMVLREQEFRSHVENHDWEQYQDSYVALQCSVDAIVPGWAYLLLSSKAIPFAKKSCRWPIRRFGIRYFSRASSEYGYFRICR